MKQIILYGTGDAGKTTTLYKLYEKHIKDNIDFTVLEIKFSGKDYMAIVKHKGYKIGIYTWGDTKKLIDEGVEYTKECDIVVCVARSRGAGYQYFNELEVPQIWIEMGRFSNKNGAISDLENDSFRDAITDQTASYIYQVLQLLCK